MIWILLALLTKHFIVDFLIQPSWMYLNKGNLRHPGGWVHAGLHAGVTLYILLAFHVPYAGLLAWMELFLHYGIDYAKVNINLRTGWKPTTSEYFWMLLGLDQYLHQLTYLVILLFAR